MQQFRAAIAAATMNERRMNGLQDLSANLGRSLEQHVRFQFGA